MLLSRLRFSWCFARFKLVRLPFRPGPIQLFCPTSAVVRAGTPCSSCLGPGLHCSLKSVVIRTPLLFLVYTGTHFLPTHLLGSLRASAALLRGHPGRQRIFGVCRGAGHCHSVRLDGALDFGIVTHCEPNRALAMAPLGKLDFRLFAPTKLLPANERLKISSNILGRLPLAILDGSARTRRVLEQEAQRLKMRLNVRLRFSSYPQLAQAVSSLEVAAIMPRLAETCFEGKHVRAIPMSFLSPLSSQICLIWNRKLAEVRPAITKYSRLLPSIFAC